MCVVYFCSFANKFIELFNKIAFHHLDEKSIKGMMQMKLKF